MANVLFLRAPSESPDRYEATFSGAGYSSSSVPVLETVFVNLETLAHTVRSGPQCGAVIITSGRACEAWSRVVDSLEDGQSSQESASDWSSTPFYVVGKSTASSLQAIRDAHPNSRFSPTDIRGESSGTSEQLARFILADLESLPPPSRQKPFLYLTGDKNRDTLPDILRSGDVELNPLQVYQTQGSSAFPDDLKLALESSQDSSSWWIVFFAPSAAEFVTPFLRRHFDFGTVDTTPSARRTARVASIGPTTSTFLQEKLNIAVDAAAPKPTPDDLLQVIRAYDKAHDENEPEACIDEVITIPGSCASDVIVHRRKTSPKYDFVQIAHPRTFIWKLKLNERASMTLSTAAYGKTEMIVIKEETCSGPRTKRRAANPK